ncbi:MAG: hypothetical protein CSA70_05290 [Rhodobacterales bacterium]|nr:MAG: hypothetical protein CSA70_05290 [Rhodobacterales bacterium]
MQGYAILFSKGPGASAGAFFDKGTDHADRCDIPPGSWLLIALPGLLWGIRHVTRGLPGSA